MISFQKKELIIPYLILFIVMFLSVYPLLYMVSVSFMTAGEASNQYLLPRELKFENYVNVWTSNNFQQYTLNSIIISAIVVGLTLLFFTPLFYYLPNAILASIIMVAVFTLIDIQMPRKLWKSSKSEFYVLLFTFLITLFIGIQEGIILGVLISLLLLVYRSTQPHVAVLGKIKGTDYFKDIDRFTEDIETFENLLLLRFDEQIYFGNSQFFKEQLLDRVNQKKGKLNVVILSSGGINYIDSSGMKILNEIVLILKSKNIQFYIAGAIGPVMDSLFKSGVAKAIGGQHFFANTQQAFLYFINKNPKNKIEEKISLQANTEILE